MTIESLAQGGIERVDGTVALGHLMASLTGNAQLDRGFGHRFAARGFQHHPA